MIIDYVNCPNLFYYRYIAKINLPSKKLPLIFGGAVHKGIEEHEAGRNPFSAFEGEMQIAKANGVFYLDDMEEFDKHLILGKHMLEKFIERIPYMEQAHGITGGGSEVWVKDFLINPLTEEVLPIKMHGKIDRLTGTKKIVEYKTSKAKWSPTEIKLKYQTLLYNLAYYTKHKELPEETIYVILLKSLTAKEPIQILPVRHTVEDLAVAFEEIKDMLNKINYRVFGRPEGYHAGYCDCSTYRRVLDVS